VAIETLLPPKENLTLIGHQHTQKYFLETFQKDRPPHAWLFSGPKGVGKSTFAYRAAAFLLSNPTGNYPTLFPSVSEADVVSRQIAQGSHPDLLVIERLTEDDQSQYITVEDIRKIPGFIQKTPSLSKWKIVLIDSADDMNINAANALLKSLEEPPSYVLFFLISHTAGRLLDTIRSRCQILPFHLMQNELNDFLPSQSPASVSFSKGSLGQLARFYRLKGDELLDLLMEALEEVTHPQTGYKKCYELSRFLLSNPDDEKGAFFAEFLAWWLHRLLKASLHPQDFQEFLNEKEKNLLNRLAKPANIRNYLEARTLVEQLLNDQKRLNQDPKLTLINVMIILETYLKP
jgi:DNA polymerase-3 subunit delta'